MPDARTLLGKNVAQDLIETSRTRVEALSAKLGRQLKLIVLTVDDPAGKSYIKSIQSTAKKTGIHIQEHPIYAGTSTASVVEGIYALNRDNSVDGILVQTPLPEGIDRNAVSVAIAPSKDVDGISPTQAGYLFQGNPNTIYPSTARAAIEILDHYNFSLEGAEVVIIGRSLVIGKPVGLMALARHATVTWCHSKTQNIKAVCKRAEILIVSAGRPKMVDATYIRPGATIIDVGINVDEHGNICGDIDPDSLSNLAVAYTPVPGGVGPVTSACLFSNLVDIVRRKTL